MERAERRRPSKETGGAEPRRESAAQGASLLESQMPLWARPGYLIRRLHQIQYALFLEECAGYDITPVQYGLLTTLAANPDIDQNTLGRELGIDRTNVADVLKRLETRGFIRRHRSTQDRRMMLARLTPLGEEITRAMYGPMQRAQLRFLDPLPPEERSKLIAMLMRLVDANNHLGRTIFQPS